MEQFQPQSRAIRRNTDMQLAMSYDLAEPFMDDRQKGLFKTSFSTGYSTLGIIAGGCRWGPTTTRRVTT